MICMQGSSDGEFEEIEGRKMKCLTNNIFFSDCGGIKDNQNLSFHIALLSERLHLLSRADMQSSHSSRW